GRRSIDRTVGTSPGGAVFSRFFEDPEGDWLERQDLNESRWPYPRGRGPWRGWCAAPRAAVPVVLIPTAIFNDRWCFFVPSSGGRGLRPLASRH
ncbi:MAG: hypothetical protein O9325_20625, partial [Roseomonas sp.]|nr:hypothetical protein [Roseomonas sp.]